MMRLIYKLTKITIDRSSPKSETRGFDSWLTLSLRTECSFPLATSDAQMMSENFIPRLQMNKINDMG